MSNISSYTKMHFFTLLIVSFIFIAAPLVSAQEEPGSPEFIPDSCLINFEDGTQVPFACPVFTKENRPVSIQCLISNNTGQELFADPSLTLFHVSNPEEKIVLETTDNYILFPQTAKPVLFTFPNIERDGEYNISVSLSGDFEKETLSNKVVEKEPVGPAPVYTATEEESNIVLYTITTLLALLVLLAILVYRRKSEPLSETFHPIEEDNNLEQ